MQKIYDKKSPITWPDGTTMEAAELMEHPVYKVLFQFDHILSYDEDDVVYAFSRLSYFKDDYGITEEDPEKALALIQERQAADAERDKVEAKNLLELMSENADLQTQVEEQAVAIEELAAMVAEMKG